jgi:hypothetical protein
MSDVNDTLKQRGEVYGDYKGGSALRAIIMDAIESRYEATHGKPMELIHKAYIYDIVNKLSRLAVTPDHEDTWLDIAGYATLVRGALNEKS